jgi:hypothetical protein
MAPWACTTPDSRFAGSLHCALSFNEPCKTKTLGYRNTDDRLQGTILRMINGRFATCINCLGSPNSIERIKITFSRISPCFSPQITGSIPPSCPARGALAIVTNVGAGCGGRWPCRRTRKRCGRAAGQRRQNRVVLTPRSWRQVGGKARQRWWQQSRSPGRARHKLENHCAGKAGMLPPNLYARVHLSF